VAGGRKPAPDEFLPDLKAAELLVREVTLNGFLQANNVNTMIAEIIF
jgi:hypothetical protein